MQESGAAPVIVVNKSDLTNDVIGTTSQIAAIAPGVPIHAVSARGRDGMGDLERYFDGNRTIVLVGSSGVGKSTLTNELLGRAAQATQEVRAHGTPRSRPLSLPGLKSFETSLLYVVLTYWLASPSRRWRYSFWRSSIRCPCVPKAAG